MAFNMKGSPAKRGAIKGVGPNNGPLQLRLLYKVGKKLHKMYQKSKGTYVDADLHKKTGYWRRVDLEDANRRARQRYGGPDHVKGNR
jgi:hypothetical protein